MTATNKIHAAPASMMYARSTTVVRSVPGFLSVTKGPNSKCVYLLPGKAPLGVGLGGSAVDSGLEKTRKPYPKITFIDLLKPDTSLVHVIHYPDSKSLDSTEEALIDQANVVLGGKFIAAATCDPYDFLDGLDTVKNYITTYEPTPEAFQSALDVISRVIPALGVLTVSLPHTKPELRLLDNTSEADITKIWSPWQEIFPSWPIERDYLASMVTMAPGVHLIHEKRFSLAYYEETGPEGLSGMISVVGVFKSYCGKGLGTALVNKTREEVKAKSKPGQRVLFGVGSSSPRFWPGVPFSFAQKDRDFFLHRLEIVQFSRYPCANSL